MSTAYHRPGTLHEALRIRAGEAVTVLAGGTDVYPARTARHAWGDRRRQAVLDVSRLADLHGIVDEPSGVRIGALATWSAIARSPLPPAFDGLKTAARQVGGAQVQNRGTIAGNLCTASPAGDGIPCLLALDAVVELVSLGGTRLLPVADFVTGYRTTALRPDELVAAIHVPHPAATSVGGFQKLGARRYLVISIAMAAAVLDIHADGRIGAARIAVGACGPVARRLGALEASLSGLAADDAAAAVSAAPMPELDPIDDVRASAAYRREAARTLVADLLRGLAAGPERRAA